MIDCLVIGGGIVGLTTARELSSCGLSVVVVDNNNCHKGSSSWAGAGIISPLYPWKYNDFINQLSQKSQKLYPQLCKDLKFTTNIDPQYLKSGLLILDKLDDDAKKWLKKWQLNYQTTKNGILLDVAQVRNPYMLLALKKDLELSRVKIINTTISKLNFHNNCVIGADKINAKNTIICGGAWSKDIIDIDISPVKGQIITIFDKQKSLTNIILKNGNYIVPRQDGVVLIGATMENVGFNTTLTNAKNDLFQFLISIYPQFKNHKITNHWCGFRPKSTSPIIDKHHKFNNLFINTGHFRNGLNTAPQSAKIITQKIINN